MFERSKVSVSPKAKVSSLYRTQGRFLAFGRPKWMEKEESSLRTPQVKEL